LQNNRLIPAAEVKWSLRQPEEALLRSLSGSGPGARLLPLTRHLLALRLGSETAEAFLDPRLAALGDPLLIPGMEAAARRIIEAVEKRERVVLYGDYDVDGITSLAQLTLLLRAYGLHPRAFLPRRMEEGYGLSLDGLARCFEELGKPALLVALDCGTSSVAEAGWLATQGVDCVIVDHHEPGASLPDCVALVNPKLSGAPGDFCTAGLVFKLLHAMLKLRPLPDFDLREQLDLAAMGTVADLVPLRGENRIIVKKGLEKIATTRRVGLRALKTAAGLDGHIEAHHIGFRLGPRLNASGRLAHAQASLDLLLSDDAAEAEGFAELLNELNRERQEVEGRAHLEARAEILANPALAEAACIVLGSRSWHPGVVGIVASRLMRDFYRPAVVIAFDEDGTGKGSGRSVPGVSLVEALDECRHLLLRGGGHAMAAGVGLEEKNLAAFREAMHHSVLRQIGSGTLQAQVECDAECTLADFGKRFFSELLPLEPFGMGNPEPVFLLRHVEPVLPGQVLKEKHWKLWLRQGSASMAAMWFNAPLADAPPAPWDLAVKLQRQFWRGTESWTLLVQAVRSADAGALSASRP
jgi:single-stranded-DNA-specific exonuclease